MLRKSQYTHFRCGQVNQLMCFNSQLTDLLNAVQIVQGIAGMSLVVGGLVLCRGFRICLAIATFGEISLLFVTAYVCHSQPAAVKIILSLTN